MRVVGLFVRNHLRKIHRVNENGEFACGSGDMVDSLTKVSPLAANNITIMANPRLVCGNCWSSRTIKVVLNPNENRLSL